MASLIGRPQASPFGRPRVPSSHFYKQQTAGLVNEIIKVLNTNQHKLLLAITYADTQNEILKQKNARLCEQINKKIKNIQNLKNRVQTLEINQKRIEFMTNFIYDDRYSEPMKDPPHLLLNKTAIKSVNKIEIIEREQKLEFDDSINEYTFADNKIKLKSFTAQQKKEAKDEFAMKFNPNDSKHFWNQIPEEQRQRQKQKQKNRQKQLQKRGNKKGKNKKQKYKNSEKHARKKFQTSAKIKEENKTNIEPKPPEKMKLVHAQAKEYMSWHIEYLNKRKESDETYYMNKEQLIEYYFLNRKELRKTFKYEPELFGLSPDDTLETI